MKPGGWTTGRSCLLVSHHYHHQRNSMRGLFKRQDKQEWLGNCRRGAFVCTKASKPAPTKFNNEQKEEGEGKGETERRESLEGKGT